MALTKHFLPLGYMQEEELGHPDALRIMRDKQAIMEDQLKRLQAMLGTISSDYTYLKDFCEREIQSMNMQQQAFQNYADELRKGLRELRKAEAKDTARLNELESTVASWKKACAGSKEALKNMVARAQDVLNRKRKDFEEALTAVPAVEQRLSSQIIKLQTTVAILESKLGSMEPRFAKADEVNDAACEINDKLSELDDDVSQLRTVFHDVLLELIEQHVPQNGADNYSSDGENGHPKLKSLEEEMKKDHPCDSNSETSDVTSPLSESMVGSEFSSENMMSFSNDNGSQTACSVLATDQTEERINDRFSLGNRTTRKLLTGGAVSGEDERLSSAVFSSREASSDKNVEAPSTQFENIRTRSPNYDGDTTTPTLTEALNLLIVAIKAHAARLKSTLVESVTVEVCKYAFATTMLLLIYLLDEYILICFSDRPVAMRLRRKSWGNRQPMDSLLIDFFLIILQVVLAEPA